VKKKDQKTFFTGGIEALVPSQSVRSPQQINKSFLVLFFKKGLLSFSHLGIFYMARIAFIGLGNMGGPMAKNLLRAGHAVTGFDLIPAALTDAREAGITVAESPVAAVSGAEIVITMLPAGQHVLSVTKDILPHAVAGALFIDCSTIDVTSAHGFHEGAARAGMLSVDAPVSGGVGGASAGTLTFMAGGTDAAFAKAKPVLEGMGRKIVHCGSAGTGPGTGQ
jgi:3-hydroxyisobutyrate dehydrogenase